MIVFHPFIGVPIFWAKEPLRVLLLYAVALPNTVESITGLTVL